MTNRDTGYFEKNVKNQQTSNNASRNIARNKIHTARSKSSRWGIVYSVNYVLFCLLTLYFIISKVLFGGFYSTISHTAAVVILGAAVALLFVSVILTFIVRWLRGRLYIVHLILSVSTVALAVVSMVILGAYGYLIIAVCSLVITLIFTLVHVKKTSDGFAKPYQIFLSLILLVSTVLSSIFFFGSGYDYSKDGVFVETVSYSRTVRYERTESGGARLNKVMLTAFDALRKKTGVTYEVDGAVFIDGEAVPVTVLGKHAFREVGSFDTVSLPETVSLIEEGAFINSAIETVYISSSTVEIGDIFTDSSVKDIIFNTSEVSVINCESMPGDVRIYVPRDLFDAFVEKNPAVKYNIVPTLAENEIFVMFDVAAPARTNTISRYVESYILEKDEEGFVTVPLPFSNYATDNATYGAHWAREVDGRTYRLFELKSDDTSFTSNFATIKALKSCWITGAWQEMHYLNADFSEFGGGVVRLEEFNVNSEKYTVPSEYYYENAEGYVCKSWYQNSDLSGEAVTFVSDFSKDLTIYPKFTLLPPTLIASGYSAEYDATEHLISVLYTHSAEVTPSYVSWEKDGANYNVSGGKTQITVKNVSDSGVYTCNLTVKDAYGRFASAEIDVIINITPVSVSVFAEPKESVYNTPKLPLTYTHGALLGEDAFWGELACAFGENAGVYAIEKGTLTAGENYSIIYTGADYTVTKAHYDMSGISFVGGTFTYSGEDHTPFIPTRLLPVGADGIKLGVRYEGDGVNSGTKTLKAVFTTESVNYYIPDSMTCEITINKADAVINTSGIGAYTYNGALQTVDSGATLNHNECVLEYSNNTFTTVSEGDGMIVTVTAEETRNYNSASIQFALTVLKAESVIDTSGIGTYVYNGSMQTVVGATLNHSESELVYSGNTFTTVAEGNGRVVMISVDESENYRAATKTVTISVERAESVINTDGVLRDYVYTGSLQTVSGGATLNHSEALIEYSNNTFTTVAEGRALEVNVRVPESANYKAASVIVTINVEKAESVIDPVGVNTEYVYNGLEQLVNCGAILNHSETALVYTNNSFITVAEGNGLEVIITAPESDNYKSASVTVIITVLKADASINTDGINTDLVYTGALQSVISGAILNHSEVELVYSNNTFTTVAEGNGMVVTISAVESDNYKSASATVTIRVEKADAIIDTSGVVNTYVYNGALQTVDSGAMLNHSESVIEYANNTFTTVAEGNGLVVEITAAESDNYNAATATVKITVEKAESIINTDEVICDYVYNGSLQTVNSGATLNHSEAELVYSNNTFTTVAEGNGLEVVISVVESENYKSATATVTINVEKADSVIDVLGVVTDYIYTGSLQTVNSGAALNHTEAELVYSNNTFTTVAEGDGLEVVISVVESENYKSATATVTIAVYPLKVAPPVYTETEFVFSGEEIVFIGADDAYYTVTDGSATEIGSYVAIIELKDTVNFAWEDESFTGSISWSIV